MHYLAPPSDMSAAQVIISNREQPYHHAIYVLLLFVTKTSLYSFYLLLERDEEDQCVADTMVSLACVAYAVERGCSRRLIACEAIN